MNKIIKNKDGTIKVLMICTGESRTKQSMRDECDINNIMKKYKKHGKLPELIKKNPQYGDFSNVNDYQESCNIVIKAKEQFDNLSSEVRNRFANDPSKFLEFVNKEENKEEMYKMGLAIKPIVSSENIEKVEESVTDRSKGSAEAIDESKENQEKIPEKK